ncbi:FtsX-like permease family protein [Streptomyces sp. NPDC051567]|uniref:FtsX-like permease family protein n=1 Tax=Streptomyces sp. NPDC051567 TaxID=3365660 RepID=UPI0037AAC0B9
MLGFVLRRLRGRLPLAAAVLLTVLITTTALTALLAFTRGVGEAGMRQALQGPERDRTAVVVSSGHPVRDRAKDDEAVRAFAADLFGPLPVGVETLARSRSYGLPGTSASGRDADLTLLAALDRGRVRLLAGQWPEAALAPGTPVPVAAPQSALDRLGLTAAALPADVRLDDRYGGSPLTVRVTGVYRAAEPDAVYWRLDPIGGRELQNGTFTTYGPLLTDDSVFTTGGLPQNGRSTLLTPDFTTVHAAGTAAIEARAARLTTALQSTADLEVRTELPALLRELASGRLVAHSTLLVGALQLTVLASAALLLVSHLLTERQESERVLLTARGASRRRLGALTATESLLLALPAALLAPLLTPPLLRLLGGVGPLAKVPLATAGTWLLWPVAAGCALACVLLTALPAVLRGAAAAALRRTGGRQAAVSGAVRSGADLALLVLAVLAYRQLARYSGDGAAAPTDGSLAVDPVLVAAPTLALCAGTLLVLRLLPLAARLGGRLAARGRGLGPALVGWQLARRPGRATGPVLLLVLAVSSGVLALGQHTAWSTSQRDQADFATAGGLRVVGSELASLGRGGRYAALPGGDRVIPVIRSRQELPGGKAGQVLALDAAAVAERVPVRSDLRDGRPPRDLFTPLAVDTPGSAGITLPGSPQRIDVDVAVTPMDQGGGGARLALLLRDRFGLTYRTPALPLPKSGQATLRVGLATLTDAPAGSAATPLSVAALIVSQRASDGVTTTGGAAQLTVRRISAAATADGPATPVETPAPTWHLPHRTGNSATLAATLSTAGPDDGPALLRLAYGASSDTPGGTQVTLTTAAHPATEIPGIATHTYLKTVGAAVGNRIPVTLAGTGITVRITAAVPSLPVAGDTALAVDAATLGRLLAAGAGTGGPELPSTTEWWLPGASAADPTPARAAAALRAGAKDRQVLLSEDVAAGLLEDPLSAGPQAALAALALACAVLAAIGFAASTAAAGRERSREFAVLLALGAPRRALIRTTLAESTVLVGLATAVGVGLGAAIVHLVVPLMVLTPAARRPVPEVLVDLPTGTTLLLAAAIAAVPLLSAVLGARGHRDVAARLRFVEDS